MSEPDKSRITQWHYFALLAGVTLLTFLPLTFGIFSLKNDAFIYFLPWRFHISESIQNGYYPFWSPYLYTGLPLYSDMQSGSWNPVVLTISLLTRYNMQVLQWELLLYIYVSGIGMYKLIKALNYSDKTAFIGATSYICCGFITDSGSFIPWITCAAYLPFLFCYFYRSLKEPKISTSAKLSLTLFLLLTAGYPGYIIYAGYILIAAFIYWLIKNREDKQQIIKTVKYFSATILFFLILCLPVILSFTDFFPYYSRGAGASLEQSLTDPFNLFCSISYLFPSAVSRPHEWFQTDVAMRNAYIGIFTIGFLIYSLSLPYTKVKKFITTITLFSFLFSLGDTIPLREWCYNLLPFMNTFRHPAIIRLFTSIGIILLASQGIDSFFNRTIIPGKKSVKKIMTAIMIITGCFIAYYLAKTSSLKQIMEIRGDIKSYDHLTLPAIVIMQGIVQLVFLSIFLYLTAKKKNAAPLMALNVIFFALTALPFSFISRSGTKDIDRYISSFPTGFPLPDLSYPVLPVNDSAFGVDFYDYAKFYNKEITIQKDIITPTINTSYLSFLSDTTLVSSLHNTGFAFFSNIQSEKDSTASIIIKKISPVQFAFTLTSAQPGYLNLFQQFNHHWKVRVNNTIVKPTRALIAFMKVEVPAGTSTVTFEFTPDRFIILFMYISLALFTGLIVFLVLNTINPIFRKS